MKGWERMQGASILLELLPSDVQTARLILKKKTAVYSQYIEENHFGT